MKSIIIATIVGLGFIGGLKAEEPKTEVKAPIDPLPKVSSVIWNVCDILSG